MKQGNHWSGRTRNLITLRPRAEAMERRELLTVGPDMFAAADQLTQANAIVGSFAQTEAAGQESASGASTLPGTSQGRHRAWFALPDPHPPLPGRHANRGGAS